MGAILFMIGMLFYGGYLNKIENIAGLAAITYAAFSQWSPLNNALAFMTVAYRTEFAIDDWINIKNQNGHVIGKAKDFTFRGIKVRTFDMSEVIISCEELLHSLVENLTPEHIFRWKTSLYVSKAIPIDKVDATIERFLNDNSIKEMNDGDHWHQAYVEYFDEMDFRPSFRKVIVYTYHPKWIDLGDGDVDPIGYEVAYQITRKFKSEVYSEIAKEQNSYLDMSYVVRP
jgi:small-conductance mechanosensitive channel